MDRDQQLEKLSRTPRIAELARTAVEQGSCRVTESLTDDEFEAFGRAAERLNPEATGWGEISQCSLDDPSEVVAVWLTRIPVLVADLA